MYLFLSEAYLGLKKGYLFMYNLVQFLGFSWIFVNLTVRLFILGQGWFFPLTNTQTVRKKLMLHEKEELNLTVNRQIQRRAPSSQMSFGLISK